MPFAAAAAAVETPVERTPVESTGSLADHREQFPSEKRSTRAVDAARQAAQVAVRTIDVWDGAVQQAEWLLAELKDGEDVQASSPPGEETS